MGWVAPVNRQYAWGRWRATVNGPAADESAGQAVKRALLRARFEPWAYATGGLYVVRAGAAPNHVYEVELYGAQAKFWPVSPGLRRFRFRIQWSTVPSGVRVRDGMIDHNISAGNVDPAPRWWDFSYRVPASGVVRWLNNPAEAMVFPEWPLAGGAYGHYCYLDPSTVEYLA